MERLREALDSHNGVGLPPPVAASGPAPCCRAGGSMKNY